jgi:hypothetical protein
MYECIIIGWSFRTGNAQTYYNHYVVIAAFQAPCKQQRVCIKVFFAFLLKFQATNCNNMLHYMINKGAKFQKLLLLQKLQTICEYIEKYSIFNDKKHVFNARESISRALELKRALENLIAFIDPRYPFP